MVSTSMTYALGQGPTVDEVDGQVDTFEQYILVNWLWITLPLAEVTIGIAFLAFYVSTHQAKRGHYLEVIGHRAVAYSDKRLG